MAYPLSLSGSNLLPKVAYNCLFQNIEKNGKMNMGKGKHVQLSPSSCVSFRFTAAESGEQSLLLIPRAH